MALRYGAPGSPIKGSKLVRAYCGCCKEPMRVGNGVDPPHICSDCRRPNYESGARLTGVQQVGRRKVAIDWTG
jgi:hypothetical protein